MSVVQRTTGAEGGRGARATRPTDRPATAALGAPEATAAVVRGRNVGVVGQMIGAGEVRGRSVGVVGGMMIGAGVVPGMTAAAEVPGMTVVATAVAVGPGRAGRSTLTGSGQTEARPS